MYVYTTHSNEKDTERERKWKETIRIKYQIRHQMQNPAEWMDWMKKKTVTRKRKRAVDCALTSRRKVDVYFDVFFASFSFCFHSSMPAKIIGFGFWGFRVFVLIPHIYIYTVPSNLANIINSHELTTSHYSYLFTNAILCAALLLSVFRFAQFRWSVLKKIFVFFRIHTVGRRSARFKNDIARMEKEKRSHSKEREKQTILLCKTRASRSQNAQNIRWLFIAS